MGGDSDHFVFAWTEACGIEAFSLCNQASIIKEAAICQPSSRCPTSLSSESHLSGHDFTDWAADHMPLPDLRPICGSVAIMRIMLFRCS